MKKLLALVMALVVFCGFSASKVTAQEERRPAWTRAVSARGEKIGESLTTQMKSAPFPHAARANGHIYKGVSYSAEEHYRDSSVLIFLPNAFKPVVGAIDIVVYLHGWYNSVDSANAQFRIVEQFAESGRNAALIFPEGPKFAPDSFGGKLEDSCGLESLLAETLEILGRAKKIPDDDDDDDDREGGQTKIGNVILAGHSGAYRAIAFMLARACLPVREAWLFDGQYGRAEEFLGWLQGARQSLKGRFINIYTDDGGTKAETEEFMKSLAARNIPFRAVKETDLTDRDFASSALFIHSDKTHNEVIATRNQFRLFLETSCLRGMP
jgi:hypothetical protein